MSTQPLNPAERAAAEALDAAEFDSELTLINEGSREKVARAVVAAVESLLTVAALESAATALDELAATNARVGRGTAEGPWIAAGVQGAALHVRNMIRARQSLSRPTSEEH